MQIFAKLMKWASIAALLLTATFWRTAANYQLLLEFVVCIGAMVVVMQAVRAKEYHWAVGFVAIAVLFNPVVPVLRLSNELWLLIVLACVAPFALSINATALKPRVLLSIPSITDRNPGSVSL